MWSTEKQADKTWLPKPIPSERVLLSHPAQCPGQEAGSDGFTTAYLDFAGCNHVSRLTVGLQCPVSSQAQKLCSTILFIASLSLWHFILAPLAHSPPQFQLNFPHQWNQPDHPQFPVFEMWLVFLKNWWFFCCCCLILINLNVNSYMWLVTTTLDTGLEHSTLTRIFPSIYSKHTWYSYIPTNQIHTGLHT